MIRDESSRGKSLEKWRIAEDFTKDRNRRDVGVLASIWTDDLLQILNGIADAAQAPAIGVRGTSSAGHGENDFNSFPRFVQR
jgi:hypothetical protein